MASNRTRSRQQREFRAQMKQIWQDANTPCGICGQTHIDYTAPRDHPDAFELDHIHPVSARPDLEFDPNNVRPAASRCNRSRGAKQAGPGIGHTSEAW